MVVESGPVVRGPQEEDDHEDYYDDDDLEDEDESDLGKDSYTVILLRNLFRSLSRIIASDCQYFVCRQNVVATPWRRWW